MESNRFDKYQPFDGSNFAEKERIGLGNRDESGVDCGFIIGYGGWVVMTPPTPKEYVMANKSSNSFGNDKILLQATSASITRALNVPTANSYFLPHEGNEKLEGRGFGMGVTYKEARSPIRLGYGTYAYTGEVSFELTEGALGFLTNSSGSANSVNFETSEYGNFFKRNSIFELQFFDGTNTCTIYNCVWSSFSISGNPNSAVTASISFQSNNGFKDDLIVENQNRMTEYTFDSDDLLVPYWQCGVPEVESFTLNFNRNIRPVYLNNSVNMPSYIRPGMVEVNVDLTSIEPLGYDDWGALEIFIGKKTIKFNKHVLESQPV